MARPLRIQFPDAFYHVTCRGNERRSIFFTEQDRGKFLELLEDSTKTYGVYVHAYTLMPNHFHILVQTPRANLSEFMRHFNICYTGWFNFRHNRCGHLFQGRYKAFLVDADNYLLEVSRYIHLNYARSLQKDPKNNPNPWVKTINYQWSSLPGYLDEVRVLKFVKYDFVLAMIGGRRGYRDFVRDGFKHDYANPFDDVKEGLILGDAEFVATVRSRLVGGSSFREQPSYRNLAVPKIDPQSVVQNVCRVLGYDAARAARRMGDGVVRGILCELLYRYSGLNEIEIGKLLGGINYTAVSQLRRRLRKKIQEDKIVEEKLRMAEQGVVGLMSSVKI